MKISQLAQATIVNDDDIFPVVQGDETKKAKRKDILVQSDMNENDEKSPAFIKNKPDWNKFQTEPNAKSITYNRDLLKFVVYKSIGTTQDGYYCYLKIRIPVLEYSVVSGEIVTEDLISDYRPVEMFLNDDGEPRISLEPHCFDVSQRLYLLLEGEYGWTDEKAIKEKLFSVGCTKYETDIGATREEDSNTSGIGLLSYTYTAYFEDEITRDAVCHQFFEQVITGIQLIVTDFIEMVKKEAEVINNE